MNTFDLQIHTTASDGAHTPSECVTMAKKNGMHTIAVTDHDTAAGVAEALAEGGKLGVRVIPGVEISAEDHGVHLLGLGVNHEHTELNQEFLRFAELRLAGAKQMVANLKRAGFAIDWQDVLGEATGAIIGRPHIAAGVLKRPENREKLGGIATKGEFINSYLSNASPHYVHRAAISARDAIRLIHRAGGVAIWSHPPIPDFVENCPELEKFLQPLISYGLDGLELFSPAHTEADTACLESLAERYQLIKTAGSDFHECYNPADKPWPRSAAAIGEFPTYGRSLDGILSALATAMERRKVIASAQ